MSPLATLDRSRPPAAAPLRDFSFPAFERRRLGNGLELLLLPSDRVPMTYLDLVFAGGSEHELAAHAGLALLTAGLLTEGTTTRSAPVIAGELEGLGAGYGSAAAWDSASLWLKLPSRHHETGLALLLEMASEPSFAAAEIERLRQQRLTELVRRRDQPGTQADLLLIRGIFGEHPYGRSILGDRTRVEALDRAAVADFYARVRPPRQATLIAVGDFDADRLGALAESALPGHMASAAVTPLVAAAGGEQRQVWVLDRPGAPQAELRFGCRGVSRFHPDLPSLRVLNTLFGGKFTSRLNLNLRERQGFTYGVTSAFSPRRVPGPFTISTAVSTENVGAAAVEIESELDRLRAEPPSEAEVADAVSYLLGTFPFTLQTLQGLAARLEEIATFELPDDIVDRERRATKRATAAELHQLAGEHLDPTRMTIVAVGPAEVLVPQLSRFGPVEVFHEVPGSPAGS